MPARVIYAQAGIRCGAMLGKANVNGKSGKNNRVCKRNVRECPKVCPCVCVVIGGNGSNQWGL